jgi:hypothetical protein
LAQVAALVLSLSLSPSWSWSSFLLASSFLSHVASQVARARGSGRIPSAAQIFFFCTTCIILQRVGEHSSPPCLFFPSCISFPLSIFFFTKFSLEKSWSDIKRCFSRRRALSRARRSRHLSFSAKGNRSSMTNYL